MIIEIISTLLVISIIINIIQYRKSRNNIGVVDSHSSRLYDEYYKIKDVVQMLARRVVKEGNLTDEELYSLTRF